MPTRLIPVLFFVVFLSAFQVVVAQEKNSQKICKVFLLAGQSNMVGHGVVDLDHAEHYNGGKGNLDSLFADDQKRKLVSHLRDSTGNWSTRDDVFIRFQSRDGLKVGKLAIGFTGYEGQHHFGPELQFGHVVGEHFDEPVLLLKAAWGGKSLLEDFASPSSGKTGEYYTKMLDEFREGLANISTEIPDLADHRLEIAGFVWMQGWNDMCNEKATKKYSENLIRFIKDVRRDLSIAELPFVVGELGNGGKVKRDTPMFRFRRQQEKACVHPSFIGNVGFVPTVEFARPNELSPNKTHEHHWFGNAESYFLIGDALGNHMTRLIADQSNPRVLILGDSISMGYTPHVRSMLPRVFLWRPVKTARQGENCQGTNHGVRRIDDWLAAGGGKWDVIHFNFGLHDFKHVHPETKRNSNNPDHPPQASPEVYAKQLEEITLKLKATGAKLIFATTTPVPAGGVKPFRALDAPSKYNAIATEIMKRHGIEVNDLFAEVLGREDELMRPVDVHFNSEGSKLLAQRVAAAIEASLSPKEKR